MTITDSAATLIPGPVQPRDGDRFAAWLADINWAKLFPEGRDLYYEGEHPEKFAGLSGKNSVSTRLPIRCGESRSKAVTAKPDSLRMDSTARRRNWTASTTGMEAAGSRAGSGY